MRGGMRDPQKSNIAGFQTLNRDITWATARGPGHMERGLHQWLTTGWILGGSTRPASARAPDRWTPSIRVYGKAALLVGRWTPSIPKDWDHYLLVGGLHQSAGLPVIYHKEPLLGCKCLVLKPTNMSQVDV